MSAQASGPRVDAFFLAAWRRRLDEAGGMRIQKIFHPEASTVVLRGHPTPGGAPLVLRVKTTGCVAFVDPGLANPENPTAFCMLLRKHLEGGFLRGAQQPALDRVLHLIVERRDPEGGGGKYRLVYELVGTRPNLVLVSPEGRVLGCSHRYPSDRERLRTTAEYAPPAPGSAPEPSALDDDELAEAIAGAPDARSLARSIAGVSRPLAELLQSIPDPVALLRGVLTEDPAGPFRSFARGRRVVALAGGPPDLAPEGWTVSEFRDLDQLTAAVFLEAADEDRAERSARECRKAVERVRERLGGQLEKNTVALARCDEVPQIRALGELLKVNMREVPRGETSVTLTDYASGEPVEVTIPLDPRKKPQMNMDKYFQKAKRLEQKQPMLERKRRHLLEELEIVEGFLERLEDPRLDPVAFKEELRASGILDVSRAATKRQKSGKAHAKAKKKQKKGKKDRRELRTFVSSDGLRILVGRNNVENDYLVRRAGKKGDAWLHAEGAAGAHVLVKLPSGMQRPPKRTLEEAAQLAAHFSHQRYEGKAKIMLSAIGVVKKAPNAPPGQVLVPKYETIVIPTDPQVVRRLAPPGEVK